jgi:cobalt-zinc-cadmium efflux system outer membrane protein
VVQKQVDVGAVPGTQLIKTEVELARAKQELARAQLEQSQSRAALNALLYSPKDAALTASDPLGFTETAADRNALQAWAIAHRPEVAAAQAQNAAAKGQVRVARLLRVPDLALQARTGTFATDTDRGVAVGLMLPLLDWGSAKSETKRAESAALSQEKLFEATRNAVSLDVEQAIQQVETSSEIVRGYQKGILDKSEQLAQMAQKGYEKGATSYLEVLEAQRTLRAVKTDYLTALANHSKALAQLEWATGAPAVQTSLSEEK